MNLEGPDEYRMSERPNSVTMKSCILRSAAPTTNSFQEVHARMSRKPDAWMANGTCFLGIRIEKMAVIMPFSVSAALFLIL